MTSDLQNLIELQQIDSQIAALRAEIAALPKHVAEIEAKLAGCKAKVEAMLAAAKADEAARRKHESDIQDQQQKISKYRDQSLNVKTNQEYKALMEEIKFAEDKIAASEDKILEIMVAADARKESLKKAEAELKADTAENDTRERRGAPAHRGRRSSPCRADHPAQCAAGRRQRRRAAPLRSRAQGAGDCAGGGLRQRAVLERAASCSVPRCFRRS